MKPLKPLFAFTASLILSTSAFSQIDQTIKLAVIYNSNLANQGMTMEVFGFNTTGDNNSDAGDIGVSGDLANIGDNVNPFSYSADGNVISFYDNRPQVDRYGSINIGFATKNPATISVTVFSDPINTSAGISKIWIEQISTGTFWPVLDDTATFAVLPNEFFQSDFRLHISTWINVQVSDESCFQSNDGQITITNPHYGNWQLVMYDANGQLFSANVQQPDTTLYGITSGAYFFAASLGTNKLDSAKITVTSPPSFNPVITTDVAAPAVFDIINFDCPTTSVISCYWDFGNSSTSNVFSPSNSYSAAGTYIVTLVATNGMGCQETVTDTINVTGFISGHNTVVNGPAHPVSGNNADNVRTKEENPVTISAGANKIQISSNEKSSTGTVELLNLNGQLISTNVFNGENLEVAVPQTGIYLVIIHFSDGTVRSEKMMINE